MTEEEFLVMEIHDAEEHLRAAQLRVDMLKAIKAAHYTPGHFPALRESISSPHNGLSMLCERQAGHAGFHMREGMSWE